MTDSTPNLSLPYIMPAQAQKHVTHNEAIRMLDALVQLAVADRHLAAPPASPIEGNRYIVAASPTGAWAGQAGHIAAWQDGAWAFLAPRAGWIAWVGDEDLAYAFDGTDWVALASGSGGGGSVNPTPLVGINATADTTNRLSVSSPASLFSHEGAGHQLKINKAAAADTASVLLQDAFSGRAEVGLAGDDNLHVKVSADGATWREAIVVDRTSGAVSMPFTSLGGVRPSTAEGRLTLTSGAPVMTSSVPGATALLYTPYVGNRVSLYDGSSAWTEIAFAEISIPLAGTTANTNYDVFGYSSGGVLALELVAWTNDTTRATGLARQNGVLVKSGGTSRRFLGTIRTGSAGQCDWVLGSIAANGGQAKLNVWNMYNRVAVGTLVGDSTNSWSLAASATRAANNSSSMRASFVSGLAEDVFEGSYTCPGQPGVSGNCAAGVGYDSTTTFSGRVTFSQASAAAPLAGQYSTTALGFHYFQALESANVTGTATFYGDAGTLYVQNGLLLNGRM
jgi:hypothetical protein